MNNTFDPLINPICQALRRECYLVRGLLSSGITALGNATVGNKEKYYLAFFNLSIGIERLSKLVLIVNSKIRQNQFLSEKEIRKYNHNISNLLETVFEIAKYHDLKLLYSYKKCIICDAIVSCLHCFADANKGRYANIQALDKQDASIEFEPIRRWSEEVDKLILDYHWHKTPKSKKLNSIATKIANQINDLSVFMWVNESGDKMNLEESFLRINSDKVLFKYRRYYTLLIIRSVSEIFNELSQKNYLREFVGLYEFFQGFCLHDSVLLKNKKWPVF